MDDFVPANLQYSRDEWCSRLVNVLTPLLIEGIKSIFNEAWKMAIENDEATKYLMTFQNLLCRVPKWNNEIVEEERKRIIDRSGCGYLEDLITCVHINQLKALTCVRVGNKQKKVDISIPKLDAFLHKSYIHLARKVYMNVYLFEKNVSPLTVQKNNRELELIVQECILAAIRDSIPTEAIIRAYLDESIEHEEEVTIEPINDATPEQTAESVNANDAEFEMPKEEPPPEVVPVIENIDNSPVTTRLTFNDVDEAISTDNQKQEIIAPKSIERLEEISMERNMQRKMEEASYGDDDEDAELPPIKIDDADIDLSAMDITDLDGTRSPLTLDFDEL
jgi:hypothetical protein